MTTEIPADPADMYTAHDLFRREIGLEPDLVRAVADGDVERAEIIARHIELVHGLLHHHHSGEDKHVWPKLHERGTDDVDRIVDVMEGQHADIDQLNTTVFTALSEWRTNADPRVGASLANSLAGMYEVLRAHLSLEEVEVLPLITKYLTAAEWNEMVSDTAATVDPADMPVLFGMTLYEGDPEVIDDIIENLPAEVRPVIRDLGTKAFAEYALRVHGTTTPRRGSELS
jgi:hemerythrin-like domain-containing protein